MRNKSTFLVFLFLFAACSASSQTLYSGKDLNKAYLDAEICFAKQEYYCSSYNYGRLSGLDNYPSIAFEREVYIKLAESLYLLADNKDTFGLSKLEQIEYLEKAILALKEVSFEKSVMYFTISSNLIQVYGVCDSKTLDAIMELEALAADYSNFQDLPEYPDVSEGLIIGTISNLEVKVCDNSK